MPDSLNPKGKAYRQLRKEGKFQCLTCLSIDTLDNKYRDRALCIPCAKQWDSDRKVWSDYYYKNKELLTQGKFLCKLCNEVTLLTDKDKYQGCCRKCCNAAKRIRKHRRRAREREAQGSFTKEQLQARFDFHGNICIYCKTDKNITIDHLIPICRGGSNFPSNLAPSCRRCNASKNKKTYKEFIEYRRQTSA